MRTALHNLTLASKYEFRVTKHVGIAVKKDGPHVDILWMFVDELFEPNPALEARVKEDNPFRRTREEIQPRFQFDSDELRDSIGDP